MVSCLILQARGTQHSPGHQASRPASGILVPSPKLLCQTGPGHLGCHTHTRWSGCEPILAKHSSATRAFVVGGAFDSVKERQVLLQLRAKPGQNQCQLTSTVMTMHLSICTFVICERDSKKTQSRVSGLPQAEETLWKTSSKSLAKFLHINVSVRSLLAPAEPKKGSTRLHKVVEDEACLYVGTIWEC